MFFFPFWNFKYPSVIIYFLFRELSSFFKGWFDGKKILSFSSSKNVMISTSFLKYIFAGHWLLDWQILFFEIQMMTQFSAIPESFSSVKKHFWNQYHKFCWKSHMFMYCRGESHREAEVKYKTATEWRLIGTRAERKWKGLSWTEVGTLPPLGLEGGWEEIHTEIGVFSELVFPCVLS